MLEPTNARLGEIEQRIQLLAVKDEVAKQAFTRFMATLQTIFNTPVVGRLFGPLCVRIMGTDPKVIVQLYTEDEARRTKAMTFDEMAEDALAAKLVN